MNIGFIGAGKVGKALGLYFKRWGLEIRGYYSRTEASAKSAAELVGCGAFGTPEALAEECGVIFMTVPDLALGELDASCAALVREKRISPHLCWVHVSGALASDCLAELRKEGCPVGSMHPLQSFGEARESGKNLDRALFTVEGTAEAVILEILKTTGAKTSRIGTAQKPLYHAGACIVSNYLVTLLESGFRCFEAAGVEQEKIFDAVKPLIDSTLGNIRDKGTVNALTGPIARGDYNTLEIHLRSLGEDLPSELRLYKEMAEKTIDMIAGKTITKEQEQNLLSTMKENWYG